MTQNEFIALLKENNIAFGSDIIKTIIQLGGNTIAGTEKNRKRLPHR